MKKITMLFVALVVAMATFAEVTIKWSFDGITSFTEESVPAELTEFKQLYVTFSGTDSVGREVTNIAPQGAGTNILFYEVGEDGSLSSVEGIGTMKASGSNKVATYSITSKGYNCVGGTNTAQTYLKQGNYCIIIDGDCGNGTGDILFKPNRTGAPRVYNEETWRIDFSIKNDYVGNYAQSTNFEAVPAYDKYGRNLVESISEIVVTFPNFESITVNSTYGDNKTYIPCMGTEGEVAQLSWEAVEGTPNAVRIYAEEAITDLGQYGITIPEGLVIFKQTATETVYNEVIPLSYTVARKNIVKDLNLYFDLSTIEMWKVAPYVQAVLAGDEDEVFVDCEKISEGFWKLVVPEGAYYNVTLNVGQSAEQIQYGASFLTYDGENNLFTLNPESQMAQYGFAEDADFIKGVYAPAPTIVAGTKLYLQTSVTVELTPTVQAFFGEFEVPTLPSSGGGLRPMAPERKEASLGGGSTGGSTLPVGISMTRVYAGTEGGYDIWEVVAPEETSTDIFTIYISRNSSMIYITPLTYDGEHNLFITGEDFQLGMGRGGRPAPSTTAECGTWGVYEEEVEPEPVIEVEALYVPAGRAWAWEQYEQDKANKFYAVFATAEDTAIVDMVQPYGDHVYEAIVPEGEWNTVMFCAFNQKEFSVAAVVEHTGFIVPEEGMNQYTLTTKVDGVYPGTWSLYTKPEETWTLDGIGTNAEVFIKEGGKANPENDFVETETEGIWVKEYDNIELVAGTFKCMAHKYRIQNNNSIGNGTSTPDVKVEIAEAGTYDVTFTLDVPNRVLTVEVVKASATVAVENVTIENVFVQNGMIVAEEEISIFTVTGQNVTAQNGNLKAGVYVVRTANATAKVIVK